MDRFLSPGAKTQKRAATVVLDSDLEDEEEEVPPKKQQQKKSVVVPDYDFAARGQAPEAGRKEHSLWADKYAPKSYDDLVGLTSVVKQLEDWLRGWDQAHLTSSGGKKPPTPRAVLLSGPPGIGKSTSARLVSEKLGRDIFELNASDARSKKLVEEKLQDVVQASVISFGTTSSSSSKTKRRGRVVIMDEVDGMSSSDRGGVQELIRLIKLTKCPIICICNDHGKASVRSLANYCLDLKFQRPQVPSVMKRMREVCRQESVEITDAALEGIVKSSGNDIRQVLNALQMFHHGQSASLSEINKDAIHRLSGFDACKFIFCESHTAPLSRRNEAFFADYDLLPLMISQNYIAAVHNSPHVRDEMLRMHNLTKAADAVLDTDQVARMVRTDQRWDLLTSMAVLNVRVAHAAHGSIGFPGFPEWLGKNSNATKRARMLGELCQHVKRSTGAMDKTSLRLDYVSALRQVLLPAVTQGRTGEALDLMDEYGLSRDDVFETLSELQFPEGTGPGFRDPYKHIPSTAKAAFTREYNKRPHSSQLLVAEEQAVMSRGGKKTSKKAAAAEEEDGGEDEQEGEEEEEEEEVVDVEAFRVKKGSARKPSASAAKSSASASKSSATPAAKRAKKA